MQALIIVFCCFVACPLIMFGFMWWLDRNPAEAEMKKEVWRLVKAKAKREAATPTENVRRTETPSHDRRRGAGARSPQRVSKD